MARAIRFAPRVGARGQPIAELGRAALLKLIEHQDETITDLLARLQQKANGQSAVCGCKFGPCDKARVNAGKGRVCDS